MICECSTDGPPGTDGADPGDWPFGPALAEGATQRWYLGVDSRLPPREGSDLVHSHTYNCEARRLLGDILHVISAHSSPAPLEGRAARRWPPPEDRYEAAIVSNGMRDDICTARSVDPERACT